MRHNQLAILQLSRRRFLESSVAGGAALAAVSSVWLDPLARMAHAAEENTLKICLVGCGGRGTGAAVNALSTAGPTQLVAMADFFAERIQNSLKQLQSNAALASKIDVPPERQFVGLDGYRSAIDTVAPGGVVLLATPPAFRPIHLEYAVEKGCHVFMEKSFAVDAPGVRRVLAAGKKAQDKNLKIAGGLMSRHYQPLEEAIARIHEGAIGELITCWAYRMHGPVGFIARQPGISELAHQIRNYSCFTWLNGSFLLDWLIHNLDVACWAKGAWPVSAQGQGGRQLRDQPDQLFDHYAVEYTFPDGTRLFAQGRHMHNCWGYWGCLIHGQKGTAEIGEGKPEPKLFKGFNPTRENLLWQYQGPPCNPYQREMDLLFEAIRQDKPYNETQRCAYACMVGILGRMAVESGQMITWDQAMASNLELAPGLDKMTIDTPPPVLPDKDGKYPIAMPGFTKVL
ncbi:MAG: Gfo/Idh/MocA family oxidoreductase [Thermoguttaceae bacterium]|nr:Gfo/Idh/MocA family oxidoreductase [Thermoguttaceae bacterium]MDW8037465.1 Gfo/Idh/MocA family oxidoreductase [Thermoguttaceae bacterium]